MLSLIVFVWKDFVNDYTKNGDIVFLAEYAVKFFVGTREGANMNNGAKVTLIGMCSVTN